MLLLILLMKSIMYYYRSHRNLIISYHCEEKKFEGDFLHVFEVWHFIAVFFTWYNGDFRVIIVIFPSTSSQRLSKLYGNCYW